MGKSELVIDLKRDCVPVRLRRLFSDVTKTNTSWQLTSLIEIDYVDQANGSWRPKGWKTGIYGESGKVREQIRATVKRFDINVNIPDSVFSFAFPVGTIVRNWKTNEHYLLREGGEKRYITDAEAEARVPYKRLLATNTGEALGSWGIPRRSVLLIICGGLLLLWIIQLIYLGYRRYRNVQ